MNTYTNIWTLICLSLLLLMTGCNNEDYPVYDTDQKDAVYIAYEGDRAETDSIHYEYGFNLLTEVTLKIPVKLMGMPVGRDRVFGVNVVDSATTMTKDQH